MKLLRDTYGADGVIRTTKGDQISVRLDGQTAVINLETLVRIQSTKRLDRSIDRSIDRSAVKI